MNDSNAAFRPLLKNSGFTAVAVLTLALGTGLEASMTGLVNAQSSTKTAVGSPPFSIQEEDKTAWLVRPNGERFFSLGVCCVNQGASPEEFDSSNPGYAARQHYADSNRWAETALRRLK